MEGVLGHFTQWELVNTNEPGALPAYKQEEEASSRRASFAVADLFGVEAPRSPSTVWEVPTPPKRKARKKQP